MRTSSKIFGIFFLALAIFAAGCAIIIPGAEHQWFLAGICSMLSFALLADASNKADKLSQYSGS